MGSLFIKKKLSTGSDSQRAGCFCCLQGHLNSERERVRTLKLRLTDLEAAYHATLDSLDRLKLPDAPGTPDHPFASRRR